MQVTNPRISVLTARQRRPEPDLPPAQPTTTSPRHQAGLSAAADFPCPLDTQALHISHGRRLIASVVGVAPDQRTALAAASLLAGGGTVGSVRVGRSAPSTRLVGPHPGT